MGFDCVLVLECLAGVLRSSVRYGLMIFELKFGSAFSIFIRQNKLIVSNVGQKKCQLWSDFSFDH